MQKRQPKPGQIGDFWLTKKPGRQRPTDSWCRTWYDAKSRQTCRVSLGISDFQQASADLAKWYVENERPQNGRPEDVLIETVLLAYWNDHGKNVSSPTTIRDHLAKWQNYWEGKTVSEITPSEQRKFRAWLGEGKLRPSTIDKILSTGRAALNRAKREQEIIAAPHIFLIETENDRRSREPLGRPITVPEMAKLFQCVGEMHVFLFMMILANTLARSSAIFDLRRSQYDNEHKLLDLNPSGRKQTKKFRPVIPVTPFLEPWLQVAVDCDAHYVTYRGNRVKAITGAWETLRSASGIHDLCAYSFRHGMARELRKRKVPLEQIGYFLGHLPRGSGKTSSIYAPFEPEYCGEARDAIQSVMMEVQSLAAVSYLSDPVAAVAHFDSIKPQNRGKLTDDQIRLRDELIRAKVPGTKIAVRLGVSTTAVYKARKKLLT